MWQKKSRVLIIALFMLCFVCGCDKKTKEYVVSDALYFNENTKHLYDNMSAVQAHVEQGIEYLICIMD